MPLFFFRQDSIFPSHLLFLLSRFSSLASRFFFHNLMCFHVLFLLFSCIRACKLFFREKVLFLFRADFKSVRPLSTNLSSNILVFDLDWKEKLFYLCIR